jgi:hypothetical protein
MCEVHGNALVKRTCFRQVLAGIAGALAPYGLAISSGGHGNVGVGGLATGGGVGWLVRARGGEPPADLAVRHVVPAAQALLAAARRPG